ncbi:hypothetical protein EniLVp02_0171 [Vibrio phage EniLVp02]
MIKLFKSSLTRDFQVVQINFNLSCSDLFDQL